jgi:hypothetical protein
MRGEPETPAEVASALARLGLGAEELAALAKQGSICAEHRHGGRVRYKLYFRVGTRQRVRCLGRALPFVERVRAELAQLQQRARLRQELGHLVRAAKHKLRATKRQLEPLLEDAGFTFHGLAVRRPRMGVRR